MPILASSYCEIWENFPFTSQSVLQEVYATHWSKSHPHSCLPERVAWANTEGAEGQPCPVQVHVGSKLDFSQGRDSIVFWSGALACPYAQRLDRTHLQQGWRQQTSCLVLRHCFLFRWKFQSWLILKLQKGDYLEPELAWRGPEVCISDIWVLCLHG